MHYSVGEIRMMSFSYPPTDWIPCDGQDLDVRQYNDLFRVIGTAYGGDGVKVFKAPDMRGRAPMHFGKGEGLSNIYPLNKAIGSEFTVLHDLEKLPAESAGEIPPGDMGITNIQPLLAINFVIAHRPSR
jgi:microcystin-dependent protein